MAIRIDQASSGSTGNVAFTGLDFLPDEIEIVCSQKTGVNETYAHQSIGWGCDHSGIMQAVSTVIQNKTNDGDTNRDTSNIIWLKRYDGSGNVATALKASLVSFDTITPGTNYGFTLNFSTADANYPFTVISRQF